MTQNPPDDLIFSDPQPVDWDFPPTMETVRIDSHGDGMNGIVYISQGPGPHPTVIMLHGYPGNEKNLDLAQAIRRAGWNALFFHYRGAWGSGGAYSIDNALEDVSAAYDFLRLPRTQRTCRVDGTRIALLGHSMGAYLALLAAPSLPDIRRIVAMSPSNLGREFAESRPEHREMFAEGLEAMGRDALRSAGDLQQYVRLASEPARYDMVERAAELDGRSLLFVTGTRDTDTPADYHCGPLIQRLRERGQARVTVASLEADHVFSTARIALARVVTRWLAEASADQGKEA